MTKVLGIVGAVIVISVVVIFAWPSKTPSQNSNTSSLNSTVNSTNTDTTVRQNTNTTTTIVSVTNAGFSPSTVTIRVGETVQWSNETSRVVYVAPDIHPTHLAYSGVWDDDGKGSIAPSETYAVTFTQAGTYNYHDHNNSSLTGTVIVQ